jgi:multiple sugar transport system substrate-binding protein
VRNPMFWGWNITGNWFLQALMWSQDKATVDGTDFTIDSPEGLKALETMQRSSVAARCRISNGKQRLHPSPPARSA